MSQTNLISGLPIIIHISPILSQPNGGDPSGQNNVYSTLEIIFQTLDRCWKWIENANWSTLLFWRWNNIETLNPSGNNVEFNTSQVDVLGVKKNTCGSGSRPTLFFSADPIIFSTRLTVRPYFLRVVTGCCQNGVCCHTNYWKEHEKTYSEKNYFRPTDPNFFAIWNWNHRYFFYAL
jgi:hypothetical protein